MMYILVVFILFFFNACTVVDQYLLSNQNFDEAFDIAGDAKGASISSAQKKKAPLNVEVSQAFFDQNKLNIKVLLTSFTELDPSKVVVGVVGLSDGEVVEESYKKLSDVIVTDELDRDTKIAIRFELEKKDLSEYQVRCSWGKEAEQLWAKLSEPAESRAMLNVEKHSEKLELTNLDIQSEELKCVLPPCDLSYTVVGKFINNTDKTISTAKLAVGLYWANDGQVPEIPEADSEINENEEVVDVALGLKSNESATVRVKLDKSVPQVPGGSFVPNVRLVSAE